MVATVPHWVELSATWRHSAVAPGPSAHRIDLRDAGAVDALVRVVDPEVVVHAAYTLHDSADIVGATRNVALACAATGASLVQLSTDAVFDGEHAPYAEDHLPAPVNDYGRWKLEAEGFARRWVPDVCITRTSLVVSLEPPDPATRRVFDAAVGRADMTLFTDELRQPIWAEDLVAELWSLVGSGRGERRGVWHLPGAEVLSRFDLGRRVCLAAGLDPSRLSGGVQADVAGVRPRDLTMSQRRRVELGHPPRPI